MKNIVEPERPQIAIWRLRIACWIPNATNTHSNYVILIAFPFNNSCTNVPQFYVICTLLVLFMCNDVSFLCVKICQIVTFHLGDSVLKLIQFEGAGIV